MKVLSKSKRIILLSTVGLLTALFVAIISLGVVGNGRRDSKQPVAEVEIINPTEFAVDKWDGTIASTEKWTTLTNYAKRGNDTYTITDSASFMYFVNDVNSGNTYEGVKVYLNKGIDLNNQEINSIGNAEHPFKGTFDGAYYTIYNARVNGKGLFGATENANIKNVGIYNVSISSTGYVGGIIGTATNTNIENTFVRLGNISGTNVGGLVGQFISNNGVHTISNSFTDTTLTGVGLVHTISTNNDYANRVILSNNYYTEDNAVELVDNNLNCIKTNVNKASNIDFSSWDYEPDYTKITFKLDKSDNIWTDYTHIENTDLLSFDYPILARFNKVFRVGSCYENTIRIGDTYADAENLSSAFAEVQDGEAEINILVEQIAMDKTAEIDGVSSVVLDSAVDTTIIRATGDALIKSTELSSLIIGSENGKSITIDGNRSYFEEHNLTSEAAIVSNGYDFYAYSGLTVKDNINNGQGYGGGICLIYPYVENYTSTDEVSAVGLDGITVTNCESLHDGGGIYIGGTFAEYESGLKVNVSNCQSGRNGGGLAIEFSSHDFGLTTNTLLRQRNFYQIGFTRWSNDKLGMNHNIDGSHVNKNQAPGDGGGVWCTLNGYTLTIKNVNVTGNTAANGGGIYVAGYRKSNDWVYTGGTLSCDTSPNISSNTATNAGGGIYATGCTVNTQGAIISYNDAARAGGGIYCTGSSLNLGSSSQTVTISYCEVYDDNQTNYGGGICADNSDVVSYSYTINHCGSQQYGGGIWFSGANAHNLNLWNNNGGACATINNCSAVYGGAVGFENGTIFGGYITECAALRGGGIYTRGTSTLEINNINNCVASTVGFYVRRSDHKISLAGDNLAEGSAIYNGGTLTINAGTLVNNYSDSPRATSIATVAAIHNSEDCSLTINNVSVSTNSIVYGGKDSITISTYCNNSTITICNSTFRYYSDKYQNWSATCLCARNGSTTNINGGTFEHRSGDFGATIFTYGTLNISGGTIYDGILDYGTINISGTNGVAAVKGSIVEDLSAKSLECSVANAQNGANLSNIDVCTTSNVAGWSGDPHYTYGEVDSFYKIDTSKVEKYYNGSSSTLVVRRYRTIDNYKAKIGSTVTFSKLDGASDYKYGFNVEFEYYYYENLDGSDVLKDDGKTTYTYNLGSQYKSNGHALCYINTITNNFQTSSSNISTSNNAEDVTRIIQPFNDGTNISIWYDVTKKTYNLEYTVDVVDTNSQSIKENGEIPGTFSNSLVQINAGSIISANASNKSLSITPNNITIANNTMTLTNGAASNSSISTYRGYQLLGFEVTRKAGEASSITVTTNSQDITPEDIIADDLYNIVNSSKNNLKITALYVRKTYSVNLYENSTDVNPAITFNYNIVEPYLNNHTWSESTGLSNTETKTFNCWAIKQISGVTLSIQEETTATYTDSNACVTFVISDTRTIEGQDYYLISGIKSGSYGNIDNKNLFVAFWNNTYEYEIDDNFPAESEVEDENNELIATAGRQVYSDILPSNDEEDNTTEKTYTNITIEDNFDDNSNKKQIANTLSSKSGSKVVENIDTKYSFSYGTGDILPYDESMAFDNSIFPNNYHRGYVIDYYVVSIYDDPAHLAPDKYLSISDSSVPSLVGSRTEIKCEIDLAGLARLLDNNNYAENTKIKISFYWKAATINVTIDSGDWTDEISSLNKTFKFNDNYNLSAITQTGKTLGYYTGGNGNIAPKGTWNYESLNYENIISNSKITGHSLTLTPVMVDNIYRVNLVSDPGWTDSSIIKDANSKPNKIYGAFSHTTDVIPLEILTYQNFEGYADYSSGLIDTYTSGIISKINSYKTKIANKGYDCLTTIYKSSDDYYIYLANNQEIGNLPVFDKVGEYLQAWEENRGSYLTWYYKTQNSDMEGITFNAANEQKTSSDTWTTTDGNATTFTANWIRKKYALDVSTKFDTNTNQYGYVVLTIHDNKDGSNTTNDRTYLAIFNDGMKLYNASSIDSIINQSYEINVTAVSGTIYVYDNSTITYTIFDQNKLKTDNVLEDSANQVTKLIDFLSAYPQMVGYRYDNAIMGYGSVNSSGANTKVFDVTDIALAYKGRLSAVVNFAQINYTLSVGSVTSGHGCRTTTIPTGEFQIGAIGSEATYNVVYVPKVGYELQYNAMTLNDNKLHNYPTDDTSTNPYTYVYSNEYGFKFDANWLLDNYYRVFGSDEFWTNSVDIGTITINTKPIDIEVYVYRQSDGGKSDIYEYAPETNSSQYLTVSWLSSEAVPSNDIISSARFSYNTSYELNLPVSDSATEHREGHGFSWPTGTTEIYYKNVNGNIIAKGGTWNYIQLTATSASDWGYDVIETNVGTNHGRLFKVYVYPVFVDNVYRVELTNLRSEDPTLELKTGCGYTTFTADPSDLVKDYTCYPEYKGYPSEDYLAGSSIEIYCAFLENLKMNYEIDISQKGFGTIVFDENGGIDSDNCTDSFADLHTIYTDNNHTFTYIYLANNQPFITLPVYEGTGYKHISYTYVDRNVVYKTIASNSADYSANYYQESGVTYCDYTTSQVWTMIDNQDHTHTFEANWLQTFYNTKLYNYSTGNDYFGSLTDQSDEPEPLNWLDSGLPDYTYYFDILGRGTNNQPKMGDSSININDINKSNNNDYIYAWIKEYSRLDSTRKVRYDNKSFERFNTTGDQVDLLPFNYGYNITGYEVRIGDDSHWLNSSYDAIITTKTILPADINLASLASFLETEGYLSGVDVKIITHWEATTINVTIDSGDWTDRVSPTNKKITFNGSYDLSAVTQTGKTLGYFNAQSDQYLAPSGTWNYKSLSYNTGSGKGPYDITLTPVMVDNIYRVKLVSDPGWTDSSIIKDRDNKPDKITGAFSHSGSVIPAKDKLTYQDYEGYPAYASGWIDDYTSGLRTKINSYNTKITAKTYDCLTTIYKSGDDYYIYLANNHEIGNLPVFDRYGYILQAWGYNENSAWYKTTAFVESIGGKTYLENNEVWSIATEGTTTNPVTRTLTADWYRKHYDLSVNTLLTGETDPLDYGYVIVNVTDKLNEGKGGKYFVIYTPSLMKVYNVSSLINTNLGDLFNSTNNYSIKSFTEQNGIIKVYDNSTITYTIYDQNAIQNVDFLKVYTNMFGKKCSSMETSYNDDVNAPVEYSSNIIEDTSTSRLANNKTFTTNIYFTPLQYTVKVAMSTGDGEQGTFSIKVGSGEYGSSSISETLEYSDTQKTIKYNSDVVGYELSTNAFDLVFGDKSKKDPILQACNNLNSFKTIYEFTFAHTWILDNYYSAYGSALWTSDDTINVGTIVLNTKPIDIEVHIYRQSDGGKSDIYEYAPETNDSQYLTVSWLGSEAVPSNGIISSTRFSYNDSYTLILPIFDSATDDDDHVFSWPTGTTEIYYKNSSDKIIAKGGTWNYLLMGGTSESSTVDLNWGYDEIEIDNTTHGRVFKVYVYPVFVDNIYKVSLDAGEGVATTDGKWTLLEGSDYTYAESTDVSAVELTYKNGGFGYKKHADSGFTNIEDYIADFTVPGGFVETYKENISNKDYECLKKIYKSGDDYYIYLANNQVIGNLPVFTKAGYVLNAWGYNLELDGNGNPIYYKTSLFQGENTDAHGNTFTYRTPADVWLVQNDADDVTRTFIADWYQKAYQLSVSTILYGSNPESIGQYGYVLVTVVDHNLDATPSDPNYEKTYVCIYDKTASKMLAYETLDFTSLTGTPVDYITIYDNSTITFNVYDQNAIYEGLGRNNAIALLRSYKDMVGYKYSRSDIDDVFTTSTTDGGTTYTINGSTLGHGAKINAKFKFTPLTYSISARLDNSSAGHLSLNGGSTYSQTHTISSIHVGDTNSIRYNASTGYTLKTDAFTIGLETEHTLEVLQSYSDDNPSQVYTFTLDADWLLDYYYGRDLSPVWTSDSSINLGQVDVNTEGLTFNYYIQFVDINGEILGDRTSITDTWQWNNFDFDLDSAILNKNIFNVKYDDDLNPVYIYGEVEGKEYIPLRSYMRAGNNNIYLETKYAFPIKDNPTFKNLTDSAILNNMFSVSSGIIIPKVENERALVMYVEMAELKTITVNVEKQYGDTNSTNRTITMSKVINGTTDSHSAKLKSATFDAENKLKVIEAYTYVGATENFTFNYDEKRYTGVEIYVDGALQENSISIKGDTAVTIKFIPKSLAVNMTYSVIDYDTKTTITKTADEFRDYLTPYVLYLDSEDNVRTGNLYFGDKINIQITNVNANYTAKVNINGAVVSLNDDLKARQDVLDRYFATGSINIEFIAEENPTNEAVVQFALIDNSKFVTNFDDVRLENAILNKLKVDGTTVANSNSTKLYATSVLTVDLSGLINLGYKYSGKVKYGNMTVEKALESDGVTLKLFDNDYTPTDTSRNNVTVLIDKLNMSAKITIQAGQHDTYYVNGAKTVTTYVGATLHLSGIEQEDEQFDKYLLNGSDLTDRIEYDYQISSYSSSELTFTVATTPKYKFNYSVIGATEDVDISVDKELDTYYLSGTQIELIITEKTDRKYTITIDGLERASETYTLTADIVASVVITPKSYVVSTKEYIDGAENTGDAINNIITSQTYKTQTTHSIVLKNADYAIAKIVLEGNDEAEPVEINVAYDQGIVTCDDVEGYSVTISGSELTISYTTNNEVTIKLYYTSLVNVDHN